ncbi:MAG: hypothetical protein J07HQX50_01599 [Haloquadratum sp. J07HQX50]|jgi:hypothetical protein|nr:MAG: hypothetical protein J07HQX50_01599 [Haloquadratum sp. J07HQX50]
MADGCKPSSSEHLAEVLGEIDADELGEAIKAGMETIKRADDFYESIDGPDDETKYILHEDELPSGRDCDLRTHSGREPPKYSFRELRIQSLQMEQTSRSR